VPGLTLCVIKRVKEGEVREKARYQILFTDKKFLQKIRRATWLTG